MKEEEKVEIIQMTDRRCMIANGYLICYCGQCELKDYDLPADYPLKQIKDIYDVDGNWAGFEEKRTLTLEEAKREYPNLKITL